jgi:hypothetical protein
MYEENCTYFKPQSSKWGHVAHKFYDNDNFHIMLRHSLIYTTFYGRSETLNENTEHTINQQLTWLRGA